MQWSCRSEADNNSWIWKKNQIFNKSITSIPELKKAIIKLLVEKTGDSVLEVTGQELLSYYSTVCIYIYLDVEIWVLHI